MSIGPIGPGDSVGFIYVTVLTDTSKMKDQIQRSSKENGREAASAFNREWERENQKRTTDVMFERAARRNMGSYLDSMAKEIAKAERAGKTRARVKVELGDDIAKNFEDIRKTFRKTDNDIREFWDKEYPDALKRGIEKAHRQFEKQEADQAKAAKRAADAAAKEAKRAADAAAKEAKRAADARVAEAKRVAASVARLQQQNEDAERRRAVGAARRAEQNAKNIVNEIEAQIDIFDEVLEAETRKKHKEIEVDVKFNDKTLTRGLRRSLRRAGSGGVFAGGTTFLGGLVGVLEKGLILPFKAVTGVLNGISDLFDTLAVKGGKMAGVFGNISNAAGNLAGGIAAIGGPVASVVALVGAIGLLIGLLGPLVSLVSAVAGVMVLLGAAIGNTVAAAAVLVPVLIAFGAALGVLAIGGMDAFKSVGLLFKAMATGDPKAMQAYVESLKGLSPAARETVKAFKPLAEVFKGIQDRVEKALFAGMADDIGKMLPILKMVNTAMEQVAGAVGDVIEKFFALGESKAFQDSMKAILDSITPIIRFLGDALVQIFAGLTNVFAAISPIAQQFAFDIDRIAGNFRRWSETDEAREKIRVFFENAYNIAKQVVEIIGAIGTAFVVAMGIAAEPTDRQTGKAGALKSVLDNIKGALDNVVKWLQEHPEEVQAWLQDAKDIAEAVWHAIVEIGKKFASLNTPENKQFLIDIIDIMTELISWLTQAAEWAGKLWDFIRKIFGAKDKKVIEVEIQYTNKIPQGPGLGPFTGRIARPGEQGPGLLPPGTPRAAGGLVRRPELALIGEAGMEAIIPLTRPLNRVDPSVRAMAALLRSEGKGKNPTAGIGASTGRTVNVTQNITATQTDPENVARSVVNRLVAGAIR